MISKQSEEALARDEKDFKGGITGDDHKNCSFLSLLIGISEINVSIAYTLSKTTSQINQF